MVQEESKVNQKVLLPKRVFTVTDFELSNGTLKLYNLKGLFKKKCELVKEIPVQTINVVESQGNALTITRNGAIDVFSKKNSLEAFGELGDKLRALLEEYQIDQQKNEKLEKIKVQYLAVIKSILPVIDACFNILNNLHEKRVDWSNITKYCDSLGKNLNITNQTLPPLSLNFSKVADAVTLQSPLNTANEVHSLLRSVSTYFSSLAIDEDLADRHPNSDDLVVLVDSYLTLNDVFFGKIVGDKDNKNEYLFLENSLASLSETTNFKVNVNELKVNIDKFDSATNKQSAVEDARDLFKASLSQM